MDAAKEMFGKFAKGDRGAIHPNIRGSVYAIVLSNGGKEEVCHNCDPLRVEKFIADYSLQYDIVLNEYRTAKNADERNTALRSVGRAKDAELIQRTLSLPLSDEVKEQDIYLPIGSLRTHQEGIQALWEWVKVNWDTLVTRLPPGLSMLGSVVQICTASFTKQEQLDEVADFFNKRSTKGFDQGLAQSLDSIRAKSLWLQRDRTDVKDWLEHHGLTDESQQKL